MAPVSVSGSLRRLGMCEGHAPQPACFVLSGKRKVETPEGYEASPPLRQTAPCLLLRHGGSPAPKRHTGTPARPCAWGRRLHPHGAFTMWISEVVIRSRSCALSTLELPRSFFLIAVRCLLPAANEHVFAFHKSAFHGSGMQLYARGASIVW